VAARLSGRDAAEPTLVAQKRILLDHYADMLDHHGRDPGVRLARKHVAWYSKGLPGSAEFRVQVNRCETPEAVVDLVHAFYDPLIDQGVEAAREAFRIAGSGEGVGRIAAGGVDQSAAGGDDRSAAGGVGRIAA
jgi:tRNA-dihydrouridine synthase B